MFKYYLSIVFLYKDNSHTSITSSEIELYSPSIYDRRQKVLQTLLCSSIVYLNGQVSLSVCKHPFETPVFTLPQQSYDIVCLENDM